MEQKFKVRNLSPISRTLGINVQRDRKNKEIVLDQKDYVEDILKRYNMEDNNPVKIPFNITRN